MIWQDITLSIVSITFSAALIPQVIVGFRRKRGGISPYTSVPTVIGLMVTSFTYFTLSLYFAAGLSFVTGMLWLALLIQHLIWKD